MVRLQTKYEIYCVGEYIATVTKKYMVYLLMARVINNTTGITETDFTIVTNVRSIRETAEEVIE